MNDHNYWAKHHAQQIAAMQMQGEIPAKRTKQKPLTDEQMRECAQAMDAEPLAEGWRELVKFARAIERAHGITE